MERYKNNIAINIFVVIIASFYFLVVVSQISLLKNSTNGYKNLYPHSNSAFKRKIEAFYSKVENVNLIKLLDKTTVELKRTFHDFIQFAAVFFVITLFISTIWLLNRRSFNAKRSWPLLNYQEYYLSLCILRI